MEKLRNAKDWIVDRYHRVIDAIQARPQVTFWLGVTVFVAYALWRR